MSDDLNTPRKAGIKSNFDAEQARYDNMVPECGDEDEEDKTEPCANCSRRGRCLGTDCPI